MSKFDQFPVEPKLPEEGPNSIEVAMDEREYSRTAPEVLQKIDGRAPDLTDVPGNSDEEKQQNYLKEVESRPKADLQFERKVGKFDAVIARGWDKAQQQQYESLLLKQSTKNVNLPKLGAVTLHNIRVGRVEAPNAEVPMWGSAEIPKLISPPKRESFDPLYRTTKQTAEQSGAGKASTTFEHMGMNVTLEVSKEPNPSWNNKDYHVWVSLPADNNPEIFRAKLPELSLGTSNPVERNPAGYRMLLRHVDINLDEDLGEVQARAFFKYELIDPGQVASRPAE